MNTMKRFGLTALCVVGVTLLASAPTSAETYLLSAVGDEPEASGQARTGRWTVVDYDYFGYPIWEFKASVRCRNLTPGATYATGIGTFVANRNGAGQVDGWGWAGNWFVTDVSYVDRLNADGSWTRVLEAVPKHYGSN